jgi:hypothetical protein
VTMPAAPVRWHIELAGECPGEAVTDLAVAAARVGERFGMTVSQLYVPDLHNGPLPAAAAESSPGASDG